MLQWRSKTAKRFKEFVGEKPEECEYHPGLTLICNEVYQRFILKRSTKVFELPREMPVMFEAWGLLALLVTWDTPRAQHSEVNCGRRNLVEMEESVVRQREILASGQAFVESREDEE